MFLPVFPLKNSCETGSTPLSAPFPEAPAPKPLDSFVLSSIRWTSETPPLQYRLEAELPSGQRLLLSDWSYDPKLEAR